jgi:nicotinate-nucleotide adenylyltransferase
MLLDLPHWRQPQQVVEAVDRIVAFHRPGYDAAAPQDADPIEALPGLRAKLIKLPVPQLGISATELRARVAASLPIRYLVPDAVAEYVAEHGLYRAGGPLMADAPSGREVGDGDLPMAPPGARVAHNVHVPDQEIRP